MSRTRSGLTALAATAVLALTPVGLGLTSAHAAPAAPATGSTAGIASGVKASDTDTVIRGTSALERGQAWHSPDGRTTLAMQTDGHVVLYHNGSAIWTAPGSYGIGNTLYMQADGNLVVYDAAMRPVWNSRTHSHPGAHLAIQNSGNLVVYQGGTPLWWSNHRPGTGPVDPPECRPTPHQLCP